MDSLELTMKCAREVKMPQIPQSEIENVALPSPAHEGQTLDPLDWEEFRTQAHRMLDDILEYTKNIRQHPVWQPIPDEVRQRFRSAVPAGPSSLAEVHREFMNYILPFAAGNAHPGFMGWVHGGGTPVGMLAEMLAAGLNANLGGRDQIPIEVERQITRWMQEIFGFPESATGLFVTGTSMANFIAVVIARDAALGCDVRSQGVAANSKRLTAYGSTAVHGCAGKAMDLCGIGSDALRLVSTDKHGRMELTALANAIKKDREAGFNPFLIVGTAGTVDTGAIDDLAGLAGSRAPRKTLVSRGWRMRRPGDACSGPRAETCGHRTGRFAGLRFSQMGPGSLRCRFHPGPRRRSASECVCGLVRLLEARNARAGRRFALALRLRSGSFARFPRVEDVVHAESVRHRSDRSGHFADLCAGSLSGGSHREHAGAGTAGAGRTEYRLFSLPRG